MSDSISRKLDLQLITGIVTNDYNNDDEQESVSEDVPPSLFTY